MVLQAQVHVSDQFPPGGTDLRREPVVFTGSQFVLDQFSLFIPLIQNELRSQRSNLPHVQGQSCPAQSSTPGPDSSQVLHPSHQGGSVENPAGCAGLDRTCSCSGVMKMRTMKLRRPTYEGDVGAGFRVIVKAG